MQRDGPRALVAPDSFKGTFSAAEVAVTIGRGLEGLLPDLDLCPLADGGEGTAEVLAATLGGRALTASVHDPLGRAIDASFTLLGDGGTAVVEVASASGLPLVANDADPAEIASSYGTGELIVAGIACGARRVLVAAGGSATTDGGAGALEAIADAGGLSGAHLSVLCDVKTPWESAAATFGPQKGANAAAVARLQQRLDRLAERLPRDPRGIPMTGCAGGLSGGLWAVHGAECLPGASWIMDAVRFDRRLSASAAVITGEGRLDSQTSEGKVVSAVAARAQSYGVSVFAIVGASTLDSGSLHALGLDGVVEAPTLERIEAAASRLAVTIAHPVEPVDV